MANLDAVDLSSGVKEALSSEDRYNARRIIGGLALLHTPDSTQKHLAPELYNGCENIEERAIALVSHASRLALEGFHGVYSIVGRELELSGNRLRDSRKEPILQKMDEILGRYYAAFHHGVIDGMRTMPAAIASLGPNPYRNSTTYKKLTRDKGSLTPIELADTLSLPFWLLKTRIPHKTLAELGVPT